MKMLVSALLVLLALGTPALAAKGNKAGYGGGGGVGQGGGNGSGGSQGSGGSGGSGGAGGSGGGGKGSIYGDLYVILRDGNGWPVLDDQNGCVQPLTPDGYIQMEFIEGKCELPAEYEGLTQEVEFGRLNVGRSPSKVLDSAYREVLKALGQADVIGLDPAGRLYLETGGILKTIDSPRENLALYRELMLYGDLRNLSLKADAQWSPEFYCLMDGQRTHEDLYFAAAFLGGAADKTGQISVDLVVYLNTVLGINGKNTYFDFEGFRYTRSEQYTGDVTFIVSNGDGTYQDRTDAIMSAVFHNSNYVGNPGKAAEGFAQAADDSRAIVDFIHTTVHTLVMSIQSQQ
jgi:hypothetical protein